MQLPTVPSSLGENRAITLAWKNVFVPLVVRVDVKRIQKKTRLLQAQPHFVLSLPIVENVSMMTRRHAVWLHRWNVRYLYKMVNLVSARKIQIVNQCPDRDLASTLCHEAGQAVHGHQALHGAQTYPQHLTRFSD